MLEIHEVTTLDELKALQTEWKTLLQNSVENNIFQTWEWIYLWLKHYGTKHRQQRILVLTQDNDIVAIAPLMLSKYKFISLSRLPVLEFVGSPHSDYHSFIVSRIEPVYVQEIIKYIMAQDKEWDLFKLSNVPANSFLGTVLDNPALMPHPLHKRSLNICPFSQLPESVDAFTQSLSRSLRYNLNRYMNKLKQHHQVSFQTFTDFDSLDHAMDALIQLHQLRRQSQGDDGIFADSTQRAFHRDIAEQFAANRWLMLTFLLVDKEPVAANYSFFYNSTVYFYQSGFNPDYTQYSVGHLLTYQVITDAIRQGATCYDMLSGDEPYKFQWVDTCQQNMEYYYIRQGVSSRVYQWVMNSPTTRSLGRKMGLTEKSLLHV
jgi:CelD/BcsL family acetyltransferase involved in cellulose biosynthesis